MANRVSPSRVRRRITALARPHNLSKPACRINSTVLSTAACAPVFKNSNWAAPMPRMILADACAPNGRRVINGERIFSICPRRRKYVVANNCTNRRSRPSNLAMSAFAASALSSWVPSSTDVKISKTILRLCKVLAAAFLALPAFGILPDGPRLLLCGLVAWRVA